MADENGITISQHLHKFRAFSELKKEAKGGYIEAKIKIPHHCPNFQLALYSTNNNYGDHTNLLHITPYNRQKNISSKDVEPSPESYCVNFCYDIAKKKYYIVSSNHPYLINNPSLDCLVGPEFWNFDSKEITLGSEGLR